jgi:hypothetical protein
MQSLSYFMQSVVVHIIQKLNNRSKCSNYKE